MSRQNKYSIDLSVLSSFYQHYKLIPRDVVKEKLLGEEGDSMKAVAAIEKYARDKNIPVLPWRSSFTVSMAHRRLDNAEFAEKKRQYRELLNDLHNARRPYIEGKYRRGADPFLAKINVLVIGWNKMYPIAPGHYDLHGFTPKGALTYANYLIEENRQNGLKRTELRFETGVGNHSTGKVSSVRDRLWRNFETLPRCAVSCEPGNMGIIILKFW